MQDYIIPEEHKIQSIQSILLADNLPTEIDCHKCGSFGDSFYLFYVANNETKHGLAESLEFFVINSIRDNITIFVDCQREILAFQNSKGTFINGPFAYIKPELNKLFEKWFDISYKKYFSEVEDIYNDYKQLTIDLKNFYKIPEGQQIPQLG